MEENERATKFDRIMLDSRESEHGFHTELRARLRVGRYGSKQDDIPCSLSMDVSDVGKDVVSMGRMLRAGFDMHFTEKGHKCCMEHGGRLSKIDEDDPNSDAPLFYRR